MPQYAYTQVLPVRIHVLYMNARTATDCRSMVQKSGMKVFNALILPHLFPVVVVLLITANSSVFTKKWNANG